MTVVVSVVVGVIVLVRVAVVGVIAGIIVVRSVRIVWIIRVIVGVIVTWIVIVGIVIVRVVVATWIVIVARVAASTSPRIASWAWSVLCEDLAAICCNHRYAENDS